VLFLYLFLSACCPAENKIHGPLLSKIIYVGENVLLLPGVFSIPPIITVAWALSYEFLFYLMLPIVVFGLRLKSWSANQRCLFCLAILAGYLLLPLLGWPVPLRFAMFLAGMLLSEVSSRPDIGSLLSQEEEVFAASLFIASLIMSYSMPKLWVVPGCPSLTGSLKTASLSIGCFALVLFALRFDGFIKTAFSWTPIRWLGNISYSYYLIHGLTLKLIARVFHANQWVRSSILLSLTLLLLSFVATFTSASIIFVFIEKKHSPKWRHRAGGKRGYACAAGSADSARE
jgi:peptidoglycan/LPS O-acetylase OafA/YrhL